jgi:hypothetical protein
MFSRIQWWCEMMIDRLDEYKRPHRFFISGKQPLITGGEK